MKIGTITAVDELQISILLLSGDTATVTHENEEGEVNRHNAIVTRVGEAKKAVAAAILANIDPSVPKGTGEPDHQDVARVEPQKSLLDATFDYRYHICMANKARRILSLFPM
jgi:hypothetical protein